MNNFGIKEKEPDDSEMNYDDLDSKGIQIINRLCEYLKDNSVTLSNLLEGKMAGIEVNTEDN
jgi:hypothetical protein